MTPEPRTQHEYGKREIEAARRVLIDLGQVLGSYFADSIVVVGGWVPDLLLPDADEPHVGSIDVDLALDPDKLREGRYAEIVKTLLATRRYETTNQRFRLCATVDLGDRESVLTVAVDFLKPLERRSSRSRPRLLPGFRPLDADGCRAAFRQPQRVTIEGRTITGAENRVTVSVASVADFLIMKTFALVGRDKPKDAYDICYCLDHAPGGLDSLAAAWWKRKGDPLVVASAAHLRQKFESVKSYGPRQVAMFYDSPRQSEMRARRAYELVIRFLESVGG